MSPRTMRIALIPGFAVALLVVTSRVGLPTAVDPEPPDPVAIAADGRLDLADAGAQKAALLVAAAQNPMAKDPAKPFGGHDKKAISYLERAREEIAAAKAYANDPKNELSPPKQD